MKQTNSSRTFFMVPLFTPAAAAVVTPVSRVAGFSGISAEPQGLQETFSDVPACHVPAGRFAQGSPPKLAA
jgi:hypothetical protein